MCRCIAKYSWNRLEMRRYTLIIKLSNIYYEGPRNFYNLKYFLLLWRIWTYDLEQTSEVFEVSTAKLHKDGYKVSPVIWNSIQYADVCFSTAILVLYVGNWSLNCQSFDFEDSETCELGLCHYFICTMVSCLLSFLYILIREDENPMALVHIAHIYEGLANSVRTFPVLILYFYIFVGLWNYTFL